MDGTLWVALGLLLAVLIGTWLWVRSYVRQPSEYEKAYAELQRATQAAAEEIGKALRPAIDKAAASLSEWCKEAAAVVKKHDRK